MLHRFGELTIIVLGEFFIKLIASSSGREPLPFNFFLGFCLLLISVSLWWIYFDHTDHVRLNQDNAHPGVWVYMHYFLLAAIIAYGVVGTKVFVAGPGEILSQEKRVLLCVALAIVVVALGIIDWASPEQEGPFSRSSQLAIRLASALVLLLVAAVGGAISVGWLITLVALVLVIQVGIDVGARMRNWAAIGVAASHS
jgi:low temperature requirement protein LtrA